MLTRVKFRGVPSSRSKLLMRAEDLGGLVNVWGGDLVDQAGEFAVGERDGVQSIKFLTEIGLQCAEVVDVGAVCVFETDELGDEAILDISFP